MKIILYYSNHTFPKYSWISSINFPS